MIRVLVTALVLLVASGCAEKRVPQPSQAVTAPAPFTDQQIVDELARQGVGAPRDAQTPPAPRPGQELPTEVRQTPRGVVITFRHVFFAFDSSDLDPGARLEIERMAIV